MSFNFTDEDLQAAGAKPVFNGGVAGRVKNVVVTMEEAGVDGVPAKTNENAPDFKVYFEDSEGHKVSRACFDLDPDKFPNQWGKTYEQSIKKEWAYLNKIVEYTGGEKVMEFENTEDLFRKIKANIGTKPVNIFVNYGSASNPKAYLEPRKWLPAVEAVGTPDTATKLVVSGMDCMQPISADKPAKAEDHWI